MISKLVSFLAVIGLCYAAPAIAEEMTVTVTGRGASYNTAVLDGLQQAVAQVTGITVDVNNLYALKESIADTIQDGVQTGHSKLSQEAQSAIISKINGYISGYNILSSQKNEEGLYLVEMTADIEKYNAPGTTKNRYGLAIVGVTAQCGKCFGAQLCPRNMDDEMTQALVAAFTATRKFSVLDRDEQTAYEIEKAFIKSSDSAAREVSKLGNVKGADFILTGKVRDVNIWKNAKTIEMTGETIYTKGASAIFDYKIIVFATRQVKAVSSVKISLSAAEMGNNGCLDIFKIMMKKIADKIAQESIDNIYPPRVINVKGNHVYINMGGDSIKTGSTYGIYALGEELLDPYTGESLGEEETRIGLLQITTVKPKYSVGKIIEGSIDGVEVNQICRPEKQAAKPAVKKAAPKAEPQPDYSLPLN